MVMNLKKIWKMVREISEETKVNPYRLMAIILTESSGDPTADSGYARGLTQLSEIALKDINKAYNLNISYSDLFDPRISILAGALYLKRLKGYIFRYIKANLDETDTFYDALVQMAWNWGTGSLRKWLNKKPDNAVIDESVPQETKAHLFDVIFYTTNLRRKKDEFIEKLSEIRG